MGIPHTHERIEWSFVFDCEFVFQENCNKHCIGYCDRPSSDDEEAGSDGGCANCGEHDLG